MTDEEPRLLDPDGNPLLFPKDGYHLYLSQTSGSLLLWLQFQVHGEIIRSFEVAHWESPTRRDYGECCRLYNVLDAICRFLNTGGSLEADAPFNLPQLLDFLRGKDVHGLLLPESYTLVDSAQNADGEWEHRFINPNDQALCWVDGSYVERIPLDELLYQAETNLLERTLDGSTEEVLGRESDQAPKGAVPADSEFAGSEASNAN